MARQTIPAKFGIAMLAGSAAFVVGSLSHIPIAIGPLKEPKIIPATIVEGLCALALAVGGVAILRGAAKAWETAIGAHIFVMLGVSLGVIRLSMGVNPRTVTNDVFHYTSLVALAAGLVLLWLNEENWRIPPLEISVRSRNISSNI